MKIQIRRSSKGWEALLDGQSLGDNFDRPRTAMEAVKDAEKENRLVAAQVQE